MEAHLVFDEMMQQLAKPATQALKGYGKSFADAWLSQRLVEHNLLYYLDFVDKADLVSGMHALLYAYTYPGTYLALMQLSRALFGLDSLVIIDESPALVHLKVVVSNPKFFFAIGDYSHAVSEDFAVAEISLDYVSGDPHAFLQQFLPAGVILGTLEILISMPE
jgi:hypothetical protein